jgi:drug/metabolite transporter (DMT)-like permease
VASRLSPIHSIVLLALSLPHIHWALMPNRATRFSLAAIGIFSNLLAFRLWTYAGALVPSERLGMFLYMIPIVSVDAGMRFLEESLTLQILLGGALIIVGVWIASRVSRLSTCSNSMVA